MTMRPVKYVVGWKQILQLFQIHTGRQCALGLSGQIVWTDICSIVSGVGCNSLYFRYINIAYQATMGAGGGRAAIPSTDNSRSYLQWHLIRKSQWVISSINSNRQQVRVGWNRIFIRVLWCTEQVFSWINFYDGEGKKLHMKIWLINHVLSNLICGSKLSFLQVKAVKIAWNFTAAYIFQIMCAKHCIGDHQILNISQGLKICIMGIFYDNLRCPVQLWVGGNHWDWICRDKNQYRDLRES